jgi:hypothetical protein
MIIVFYLTAIVAANLIVAQFGAWVTPYTAALFIGFDFVGRDHLHEQWQGRGLWWKMALLIGTGSLLSAFLNWNALPIAIASCVAFAASNTTDGITYALLGERSRMVKMNGSNVVSAAVDSLVFPTLAFGVLMPEIVIAQWVAKVAGGFIWSLLLNKREAKLQAAA